MNAQTVVGTFAPFVGTEGLRGIVSIRSNKVDPLAVVIIDDRYGDRSIPYDIAHGFLLSRLAEGLGRLGISITESALGADEKRWWVTGHARHYPDYPSAILAAARVEWPKREEKEQPTLPPNININGVVYRREAPHE